MKYNSLLDVDLSAGSSFVGVPTELLTVTQTATANQSVFVVPELLDGTLFLVFVDGLFYEKVVTATSEKNYEFDDIDTITFFAGFEIGTKLTCFYANATSSLVAQAEPVTLSEAKEWIKVDDGITEDDTLITNLIVSARIQCEGYLGMSLIARTVTAVIDNSLGGIELPYGPVGTFTSLEDENGDAITDYVLQGVSFKTLKTPAYNYMTAIYAAGYAVAPENYKTAIKEQIAYLYENRGDVAAQNQLSPMVQLTLQPYRRVW